jgi:hypothetical protein
MRWLAITLLLSSGCAESPANGFESFYAAMVDASPSAMDRLSSSSRAELEKQAAAHGYAPQELLRASSVRSTLRDVKEIERNGDRAVLLVTDALGKSERVQMVLEAGRWRVELAAQ